VKHLDDVPDDMWHDLTFIPVKGINEVLAAAVQRPTFTRKTLESLPVSALAVTRQPDSALNAHPCRKDEHF